MKVVIILLLFLKFILCIPKATLAQVVIDGKGIATTIPGEKLNPTNPITLTTVLPVESRDAIKKMILTSVTGALDNLNDKDLKYYDFYSTLWSSAKVDRLIQELLMLEHYLKTGRYDPTIQYMYVPSPAEIENDLLNQPAQTIDPVNTNDDTSTYKVWGVDVYRHWLINRVINSVHASHMDLVKMNQEYLKAWRTLESWFKQSGDYIRSLDTLSRKVASCNNADLDKIKKFNSNVVFLGSRINQLLQDTDFYIDWLWFTKGIIYMNPFFVTNPERQYPSSEPNSLLSSEDSIIIAAASKPEELKKFRTTNRLLNQFKVINKIGEKRYYVTQYDAANKYKVIKNPFIRDTVYKKETVIVLVHNVPDTMKVNFQKDGEDKDIVDQSQVMKEINTMTGTVSDFAGKVSGAKSGITAVNAILNPQPPSPYTQYMVNAARPPLRDEEHKNGFDKSDKGYGPKSPKTMTTRVNSMPVKLSGERDPDKRKIIQALYIRTDNADCKINCPQFPPQVLIDSFINRDYCYTFNYSSDRALETSTYHMIVRWNCFLQEAENCAKTLSDLLTQLSATRKSIGYYILISNRSLPPADMTENSDNNTLYRTEIFVPDLPDAGKQRFYSLVQSKQKDGKDEASTTVAKKSITKGISHYLDLSAGVAYTVQPYYRSDQSGTAFPTRTYGDQFQFIAALHYYPFGLRNLNNKFWTRQPQQRISAFVGLSVLHALDNYYGGIGYDLIPGIKICGGGHLFKNNRYKIFNNQVIDKASGLEWAGYFVSVNIGTSAFISLIGLFK
jgi:hypothetical protein